MKKSTRLFLVRTVSRAQTLLSGFLFFARDLASRFSQARMPLIGRASSLDYIPAKLCYSHVDNGYSMFRLHAWSTPFWFLTVRTDSGDFLHACLARGAPLPRIGAPVSLVAGKAWPWSKKHTRIKSFLRPQASLLR